MDEDSSQLSLSTFTDFVISWLDLLSSISSLEIVEHILLILNQTQTQTWNPNFILYNTLLFASYVLTEDVSLIFSYSEMLSESEPISFLANVSLLLRLRFEGPTIRKVLFCFVWLSVNYFLVWVFGVKCFCFECLVLCTKY